MSMSNSSQADVVYYIVIDYIIKLRSHYSNIDERFLSAMSLLCKVKRSFTQFDHEEVTEEESTYIEKIKEACGNHYKEILPICTEKFIENYISDTYWGLSIQSSEVTELVLKLIEEKKYQSIYNPFAGLASYGIADFIHDYHGEELDPSVCKMAQMRLELNGYDYRGIEHGDSVSGWNTHGSECIVSTPPFGMSLRSLPNYHHINSKTTEQYVLERFIESRTKHAYYIMPSSVCSNHNSITSKLRQQIVDGNMIDMVVQLPSGIYSRSAVSTSLIVLNKERNGDDPVLFVDASESYKHNTNNKEKILDVEQVLNLIHSRKNDKCIEIGAGDIAKKRYTWNVLSYLLEKEGDVPQGYLVKTLREVLVPIAHKQVKFLKEERGRVVNISSLASEDFHYFISPSSFEESEIPERAVMVEEPVLLFSSIGKLKPTYCVASPEEPVYLHPHVYGYKLAFNGLDPEYLCWELSKKKLPFAGSSILRFRREDILDTRISFPPLNEQTNIFREASEVSKLAKAKELGLQEVIDGMKADYINVIRARKHDMRPYVRELGSVERMMRQYIRNIEPSDVTSKMNSLLNQHKIALDKLKELIDIFSEEQQFGKPEQFNINRYFYDLERNHDETSGYRIEYNRDDNAIAEYGIPVSIGVDTGEDIVSLAPDSKFYKEIMEEDNGFPLIVDINHLDFERLVKNIIENAISHGFTDPSRDDYGIVINLTIDMDKRMFQIDFSNNGMPLPSGMDKQRYGILGEKAGTTGRTGRGGYIVKSIVEHYNGDYDIFKDGQNTVVRILLPISNYDYEYE